MLEDDTSRERALSLLPLHVEASDDARPDPYPSAGTARVELRGEAVARLTLVPQEARPEEVIELEIDEGLLARLEWSAPPHPDNWCDSEVDVTVEGARRVELELFLPRSEETSAKVLHITDGATLERRDVHLARGALTRVLLVDREGERAASAPQVFHLYCEPERADRGIDGRRLGFVLSGTRWGGRPS